MEIVTGRPPFAWAESVQYSQSVAAGDLVFTAGQGGFDDAGNVVEGGFEAQVRQTFANVASALAVHGASLDGIVKLTVYVADRADYDVFKRVAGRAADAAVPGRHRRAGHAADRRHAVRDGRRRRAGRRAPGAMSERYPTLLSPIRLGPATLRNRIVSTSHQTNLVHDGVPTDDFLAYQEARARGGAAAIFIEATGVHETGLLSAHSIAGFDPAVVPVYRRVGDALRSHGACLFLQLFHGGRERITVAAEARGGGAVRRAGRRGSTSSPAPSRGATSPT